MASGFTNSAGQPVAMYPLCNGNFTSGAGVEDCVHRSGITGFYVDYQPVSRLHAFQWTETGIYVVLAVALFTLVALRMRRSAAAA